MEKLKISIENTSDSKKTENFRLFLRTATGNRTRLMLAKNDCKSAKCTLRYFGGSWIIHGMYSTWSAINRRRIGVTVTLYVRMRRARESRKGERERIVGANLRE